MYVLSIYFGYTLSLSIYILHMLYLEALYSLHVLYIFSMCMIPHTVTSRYYLNFCIDATDCIHPRHQHIHTYECMPV